MIRLNNFSKRWLEQYDECVINLSSTPDTWLRLVGSVWGGGEARTCQPSRVLQLSRRTAVCCKQVHPRRCRLAYYFFFLHFFLVFLKYQGSERPTVHQIPRATWGVYTWGNHCLLLTGKQQNVEVRQCQTCIPNTASLPGVTWLLYTVFSRTFCSCLWLVAVVGGRCGWVVG